MSKRMKHESEIIQFNPIQVSEMLTLLDNYGIDTDIDDRDASEMFSELLVEALRLLSREQVEELLEGL